jgi:hypothetical protein
VGRQVRHRHRSGSERDVSIHRQRNESDVEGHCIILWFQRLRAAWIATGIVYCADAGNESGEVFKYPGGGSPIAVFSGNFDLPLGTVAAEK